MRVPTTPNCVHRDSEALARCDQHRSPSPMQSLPIELLSYAFRIATHQSCDRRDTVLSPLSLSQVCRHWRWVALSSGTLWTSITLTFPTTKSQLLRSVAWLKRSRTYPLDILLDFRDPSWDWDEEEHGFHWQHMETVTRLLLPYVTRWQIFELLTDTWAPIFTFLHYTQSIKSAPMLRSLALSRCNAYFATNGMTFQPVSLRNAIPLFGGAVNTLQEVSLAGVHIDWAHSGLQNLVKLELKYHAHDVMPSLKQFVDILAASPDLESLSIIGWGPRFQVLPGDVDSKEGFVAEEVAFNVINVRRSIHLPRLTYFSFGFLDVEYAVELLSLFKLSALQELVLEDVSASLSGANNNDASHLLEHLTTMHSPSCPSLEHCSNGSTTKSFPIASIQTLALRGVHAREGSVKEFIRSFTSLRQLSLFDIESNVLCALYPYTHEISLLNQGVVAYLPCAELTDLTCRHVDSSVLVDVISARSQHGVQLQRTMLDVGDDIPTLSDQECAAFRDVGVQLICNEDLRQQYVSTSQDDSEGRRMG